MGMNLVFNLVNDWVTMSNGRYCLMPYYSVNSHFSVDAHVRLPHFFHETLGGSWYHHVKLYLNMKVPSDPLKSVDDLMTSLILSQEASHPSHKRHVPATHSTDFVPLNEEYTAKAKTLTTEMLEGIPIKQLTQAAREMALALVQSMPEIFPTY